MNELDVNVDMLRDALKTIVVAAPHRSTLPVLANVKMEVKNSELTLACTDLETYMITSFPVMHNGDFALTVCARDLLDFISNLTGNASISFDKMKMNLKCGTAKASFPTIDALEFPGYPVSVAINDVLVMESSELNKVIDMVSFAASSDMARPVLQCVDVSLQDNNLTMACTDGFRVSEAKAAVDYKSSANTKFLVSLVPMIKKLQGEIIVTIGNNSICFESKSTRIYSLLVEGNFPAYRAIMPKSYKNKLTISSISWLKAILRRCIAFNPTMVKMFIEPDGITFSVETEEKGKYDEKLPLKDHLYSDETPKEIALNPSMLIEAVTISETLGKELVMHWNEKNTPVGFSVNEVSTWETIQMPMMI